MSVHRGGRGPGHVCRSPLTAMGLGGGGGGGVTLSALSAPTISGDAVVGQRLFATNGTYNVTPDSYSMQWYQDGTALTDQISDSLLILDEYQGSVMSYSEIAHKVGDTDSSTNTSTGTSAVAAINLANAITSITRTSSSGTIPMTVAIAFGANVYAGYILDRIVYTDATLSTFKNGQEYNSLASHVLSNDDLQAGATINWSADGGPAIAATDWVQYRVRTTSPNAVGYHFTYSNAISPTDAVVPVTWNPQDSAANNTFSTDHLTVFGNAPGDWWVRGTKGVQPGEHKYFELDPSGQWLTGVLDASFVLTNSGGFGAESPDACVFDANAGVICYGSGYASASASTVGGHHVGVEVNYTGTNPVVTFFIDGVAVTPTTTMTSVTSAVYPGGSPGNGGNILGRFKSSDWTHTPPTGATQL